MHLPLGLSPESTVSREREMFSSPQRATIVLEHASATIDLDDEDYDDSNAWSVVAYPGTGLPAGKADML
jgi:hypothetical protein